MTGTSYVCNGAPGPAGPNGQVLLVLVDGGSALLDGGVAIIAGPPGPVLAKVLSGTSFVVRLVLLGRAHQHATDHRHGELGRQAVVGCTE